ncbi:MAG: hypothetical protein ACYTEL_09100 [Planctomycetota bacterium]|jgi:hypothetical protein
MKPADNIMKLINQSHVTTDPHTDDRILNDALADISTSGPRQPNIWRIIMTSKITKLAVVTTFFVTVTVGVIFLDRTTTTAYALEKTIEAIRNVNTVHIIGRDWEDRRIEIWAQANPRTKLMEYWYLDEPNTGRMTVSTPHKSYHYDRSKNIVRIVDGPVVSSIFRLGKFFEDMALITKQLDGRITYTEAFDPNYQKDVIVLSMSSSAIDVRALIDQQTKLPLRLDVVRGNNPGSEQVKHADEILYHELPPAGLFDFQIPEDATVLNESPKNAAKELPASVFRHVFDFHAKTVDTMTNAKGIWVNTEIWLVDDELSLTKGGFLAVFNDSNDIWTGEVAPANTDAPNMALFDKDGKKQEVRMMQRPDASAGKFRIYWQLDEPLHPGQSRIGLYWLNPTPLTRGILDGLYKLRMKNSVQCEVVQSFLLIVPSHIKIHKQSEPWSRHKTLEGSDIYVWQKHFRESARKDQIVDVKLRRQDVE